MPQNKILNSSNAALTVTNLTAAGTGGTSTLEGVPIGTATGGVASELGVKVILIANTGGSAATQIVVGPSAVGDDVTGAPVLVGGKDSAGHAEYVLVDITGAVVTNGLKVSSVVLASAARTTTQTGADTDSRGSRSCHLIVDVTSAGTGSITPKIQGKDANGVYYDILVGTAITSNGTNVLKVGLGMTPVANAVATDQLPKNFRVIITANNANAMTYSVGVELMA